MPFDSAFIKYDEITVYIPEQDVLQRNLNVIDHLKAIPRHTIRSMQRRLNQLAVHLQYSEYDSVVEGTEKDAAALAFEEAYLKWTTGKDL